CVCASSCVQGVDGIRDRNVTGVQTCALPIFLLIMVSIFILSGGLKIFTRPDTTVSILFGIFIGVTIASYTLVDKAAVSVADLSPIIYFYLVVLGQAIVL